MTVINLSRSGCLANSSARRPVRLKAMTGRPVIALSRTGRLADELARQPERDKLITVIPVQAEQRIVEAIQAALSMTEKSFVTPLIMSEDVISATQFPNR